MATTWKVFQNGVGVSSKQISGEQDFTQQDL